MIYYEAIWRSTTANGLAYSRHGKSRNDLGLKGVEMLDIRNLLFLSNMSSRLT